MVNISGSANGQQNSPLSSTTVNSESVINAEYPGQDFQMDGSSDGKIEEMTRKVPYTMHGVLHYLQHEWSRYEMDRAQWEMERAELQARISFLQGERKGQESLKADLVRRIKMLEYSLKQERAKNYRLTHGNQEQPAIGNEKEGEEDPVETLKVPLEVDAYSSHCNSSSTFRNARALLRQYLQEIGYTETILDVRSFRIKNLLGMAQNDWHMPESDGDSSHLNEIFYQDRPFMEVTQLMAKNSADSARVGKDESDSDSDERVRKMVRKDVLDPETVDALGEFSFLKDEKVSSVDKWHIDNENSEWPVNQQLINQMKEKYRSERKRGNSQPTSSEGTLQELSRLPFDEMEREDDQHRIIKSKSDYRKRLIMKKDLDLANETAVDIKDDFVAQLDDDLIGVRWNLKFTLRSHFDSIRVMQFHPVEPVLITASEDGTAKLWNLGGNQKSEINKGAQVPSQSTTITELEPVYTFRGHSGAILSMDMSPTGDMCYTGGLDGVICCWSIPSVNIDVFDVYDSKVLMVKMKGHTDAIWSIAYHSSDNRLVSASADGTIKLWQPGDAEALLKTFGAPSNDLRPTSVDFVSTEHEQLLAAYKYSHACILDIETGRTVLSFDFGNEDAGLITKILSHPTMPVTLMASDDRKIRYFANNTGKLIHSNVAHVEAISSLAVDPNGLYLLSGSHDGSLRLWNMEKRVCLQEIAAHRKKFDSAVMSVAFHPSRPLIGSAGADGLAKVFSSQKYSCGSSEY